MNTKLSVAEVFEWAISELDKVQWHNTELRPAVQYTMKKALAMMEVSASAKSSAGEKIPTFWQDAFNDRHQFDDYPDQFMTGLRNEFAAGWHAALKATAKSQVAK